MVIYGSMQFKGMMHMVTDKFSYTMFHNCLTYFTLVVLLSKTRILCREMIAIQRRELENKLVQNQNENRNDNFFHQFRQRYVRTRSRIECGMECLLSSDCESFSYSRKKHQCVHFYQDLINEAFSQEEDELKYYYAFKDCHINGTFCPVRNGYIWHREACFCYKFYNITRNYSNAVLDCKADMGHLARIDRRVKQKVLANILDPVKLTHDEHVRIQGYLHGSQWYYADGLPLKFYNWNENGGQPDGQTGLSVAKEFGYLWHDVSDDTELPFLCEVNPDREYTF